MNKKMYIALCSLSFLGIQRSFAPEAPVGPNETTKASLTNALQIATEAARAQKAQNAMHPVQPVEPMYATPEKNTPPPFPPRTYKKPLSVESPLARKNAMRIPSTSGAVQQKVKASPFKRVPNVKKNKAPNSGA